MALIEKLLILMALWGGEMHSGYAPHYAKGVMEQVSRNRDLPIVDCMVSSPRYPIGTWVHVVGKNTGVELYCRVTDISHPLDRARHLRTRREVELGYTEAQRLCGSVQGSAVECPVVVFKIGE